MPDILDFGQLMDGLGPPVAARQPLSGHSARARGLCSPGRFLPTGGPACALLLDEQALAPNGKDRTTGRLQHGVPLFSGNDRLRSVPESAHERPGRGLR